LVDRSEVVPLSSIAGEYPRLQGILGDPEAHQLVAASQIQLRLTELEKLDRAVQNPYTQESHLQQLLTRSPWIFGGEYVALGAVRRLTLGTEVDLPLIRPDGVLHVVELKRANVRTVKRHGFSVVPTAHVHDAVAQVAAYLREFDERRAEICERYDVDPRRASGTVVIGHPMFDEFDQAVVHEALRSYGSHLSRIDVMTYQQLVQNAQRCLEIADLQNSLLTDPLGGHPAAPTEQSPAPTP
jgi:hypothetical protein